jgi:hypothetical protein
VNTGSVHSLINTQADGSEFISLLFPPVPHPVYTPTNHRAALRIVLFAIAQISGLVHSDANDRDFRFAVAIF